MNKDCCTYRCEGGDHCPVRGPARPAMYDMPPSLARAANERIRRLEAGRAHLLTLADAPGNTLDDFAKWWGNRAWWEQIGYVFGLVLALGMAVSWMVGWK